MQSDLLDRRIFRSFEEALEAITAYRRYYNYHRLHCEIGWLTPTERYDRTPFTDRGFAHIPQLEHLSLGRISLWRQHEDGTPSPPHVCWNHT